MMDHYTLSIKVTFDQELAIQTLFEHRGWSFEKLGLHDVSKVDVDNEENNLTYNKQHDSLNCVQQYNPVLQFVSSSTNDPDYSPNSYHLTLLKDERSESMQPNMLDGQDELQSINNEFQKHNHKRIAECSDSLQNVSNSNCLQRVNDLPSDLSSSKKSRSELSLTDCTYGHKPISPSHAELTDVKSTQISAFPDKLDNFSSVDELDTTAMTEKIIHMLVTCVDLNVDKNELRKKINEIIKIWNTRKRSTKSSSEKPKADETSESSNSSCDLELVVDEIPTTNDQVANMDSMVCDNKHNNRDCGDTNVETNYSEPEKSNDAEVSDPIEHVENVEKMQSVDLSCSSNSKELQSNCNGRIVKNKSKLTGTSKSKLGWTVNRNLRMHKYHRKCRTTPPDLNEDMYSSSEKGYYCPDCQFIFKGRNKLLLHKQLKNGHCLPDCIYCDADDDHKQVYHCDKCPKCFQTSEMLEKHLVKHTQNLFSCHICDVRFYTIHELNGHTQSLHPELFQQEHLCDLCGSKFKEKKVLNAHVKYVHSDKRPERCSYCGKCFKTKSQLKNHLVTHKSISDLNISCEVCGRGFLRKATLKEHVRRHLKEFSFFCSVCSKGFYRQYDLEEHMRIHTGDKPYVCNYCGFKCALSCNLIKHMKVHQK